MNGTLGPDQKHFFSSKRSAEAYFFSNKEGNKFNTNEPPTNNFYSSSNENKDKDIKKEEFSALVYVGGSNASGQLGLGERMSG